MEPKDARSMYESLNEHYPDEDFPLFRAVYEVLRMAPVTRHYDEEELASEALDALDYLVTDGKWLDASDDGRVGLEWDGHELKVYERASGGWEFRRSYEVDQQGRLH